MKSEKDKCRDFIKTIKDESNEKVTSALGILSYITDSQRRDLERYIKLNMKYQGVICKTEEWDGVRDVCNNCNATCCGILIESLITEIDFFIAFYVATEKERAEMFRCINDVFRGYCSFLGKDGCVFPRTSRPVACKTFFCNTFKAPLVTLAHESYREKILDNLNELRVKIMSIGFDIG